MAVKKLVLHQRYIRGRAWDVSGNNNHGLPIDVAPGTGQLAGALDFSTPDSRVETRPTATLGEMGAFRFSMTCNWTPVRDHRGHEAHDYTTRPATLVEGDGSFRMAIEDDPDEPHGHATLLRAWVLDANGVWSGITTPYSEGQPGPWTRFDVGHDGISTLWMAVDGRVVAQTGNVPGPVRPLGPMGLVVGHPASGEMSRTFRGWVSEVWLWTERPDPPVSSDGCCGSSESRTDAETLLRSKSMDLDRARAARRAMHSVVADWRGRFPDPVGQSLDQTCAALHVAFERQQWSDFGHLGRQVVATSQATIPQQDCDALAVRMFDAIGTDVLWDREMFRTALTGFLCDAGGGGGKPPEEGEGKPEGGRGDDPRPWGPDAALPPEPGLEYPPPTNPESP